MCCIYNAQLICVVIAVKEHTNNEEFGRMIFQKKSSLGNRTKFRSTRSAGARGGAGTCDTPCILGRVLDSALVQARVRLQ